MLIALIIFGIVGCEAQKPSPPPTSSNGRILLPNDLKGRKIESGDRLEIQAIDNYPAGLKIIVEELRRNRIAFQNNEARLEQWRYNESVEIDTYAAVRKLGNAKNSAVCQRLVNRKYFLQEIIARATAIKKALIEKNQVLLDFFDEAQIRGMSVEVVSNKLKELNEKLSAATKANFTKIDETIKYLEEDSQLGKTLMVQTDPDKFMGFGVEAMLVSQDGPNSATENGLTTPTLAKP